MKPPSIYLLALLFPKELFSFYHSTFLHIRTSRASDTTSIHLSTEEAKKIVFDEKQRPSIGASRRGSFRPKKNNGHYANQIFKLKDGNLLQYNEYYVDGSSDLVVCTLLVCLFTYVGLFVMKLCRFLFLVSIESHPKST
jgi:hypothetical protein